MLLDAAVDDVAELFLVHAETDLIIERVLGIGAVHKTEILRDGLIEDDAADGRLHRLVFLYSVDRLGHADLDGAVERNDACLVRHECFLGGAERHARPLLLTHIGEVIGTKDHILCRDGVRVAVLRTQEVVDREHENAGFRLRLGAQRNVDGHLVAVKVGVVCRAGQRVQLESAALDEHRLKRLNAQAVQRRRAVEQHRVLLDDDIERVPDLRLLAVHHLLGRFDVVGNAVLHELFHHERTEQLNGHFLRHAALIHLEFRSDDDNASAGVVNALAEQVLTEAALLTLEHIAQRLERAGVRAGDGAAAAAVINKGVHRLLQHALLVAHDDVGRAELDEALETVVAVDNAAVEVVQIARGEAAAVELDHRADLRRNDRKNVDDHPRRLVAGLAERLNDFQTLDDLRLLLSGCGLQLLAEVVGQLLAVDFLEQLFDSLGAHARLKIVLILLAHIAVFLLGEKIAALERRGAGIGDDIGGKIQDLFERVRRHVEQQAHAGRNALEVPDVADRRGQLNVAHTLAAHLALGDLHAAAVADLALIADLLILSAVAFPVLRGPENALAEKAVALGLKRAVVDGLRLFDFAVGPGKDHFGRSNADLNGVKRGVAHYSLSSTSSISSSPKESSFSDSSPNTD